LSARRRRAYADGLIRQQHWSLKDVRTIRVCQTDDLADQGKLVVEVGDLQIGVFRLGDEFFAWKNRCPHQGGPVCQGRIYNKVFEKIDAEQKSRGRDYDAGVTHIVCPWHGLEFDIRTGKFAGASDKDIMNLDGYPTQVQDGEVYVLV
jgi:nitrite reductase (NADH) small subunit